jgi:hypothetical protein
VLALGVAAAIGEDDVDAGERTVLARLELGTDQGVGGPPFTGKR